MYTQQIIEHTRSVLALLPLLEKAAQTAEDWMRINRLLSDLLDPIRQIERDPVIAEHVKQEAGFQLSDIRGGMQRSCLRCEELRGFSRKGLTV